MTIKMTLDEIAKAIDEYEIDPEYVEEGNWINTGKYQHKKDIIFFEDNHYSVTRTRMGSYWDDYEYLPCKLKEVTPIKKIIEVTEWVSVD